ncbi:MAG: regulatory protein RecX [Acetobacteraceae bacterium]
MADEHRRASSSAPPTEASLHEAALAYLARFATTEAGLRRILGRRIDRWARTVEDREAVADQLAEAERAAASVVAKLAALGAVNDAAYAESRARGLTRAGVSRRGIAARLAAKGVDPEVARAALPEDAETELAAALTLARRRRIGPFRAGPPPDAAGRMKEMGVLARAGFTQDTVRRAMDMDPEEAESRVLALRR